MTTIQQILMVGAGVAATMLTRFIPFLIFRPGRPTPKMVQYLGKALPASVFALLVVYCLRNMSLVSDDTSPESFGVRLCHLSFSAGDVSQLLAVAVTLAVHVWRKNMMLSIAAGTICYMVLIRLTENL